MEIEAHTFTRTQKIHIYHTYVWHMILYGGDIFIHHIHIHMQQLGEQLNLICPLSASTSG